MEFNFINLAHITMRSDTVVIMGEGFEINMFEDVPHFSSGPRPITTSPSPQPSTPPPELLRWSVYQMKITVMKPCN